MKHYAIFQMGSTTSWKNFNIFIACFCLLYNHMSQTFCLRKKTKNLIIKQKQPKLKNANDKGKLLIAKQNNYLVLNHQRK